MDIESLKRESLRLAKSGFLLRPSDVGEVRAWRGPSDTWIIPIDSSLKLISKEGRRWVLRDVSQVPLGAEPYVGDPWLCPAPVEEVFARSLDVQLWLAELGWDPAWGFNANFPSSLGHELMNWWASTQPLYTQEAPAVLGGWPFLWPDSDASDIEGELIFWTVEHEPYVELWKTAKGYAVRERVM
jgi:hypothetical protein